MEKDQLLSRIKKFLKKMPDLEAEIISGETLVSFCEKRGTPKKPLAEGEVFWSVVGGEGVIFVPLSSPINPEELGIILKGGNKEKLFSIGEALQELCCPLLMQTTPGKETENLKYSYTFDDIISCSPQMEDLKRRARIVAGTESSILLRGESGTGKEMFAHAIHAASLRKNGPFIVVNCSAIPEQLLESELFGYEKGAFTGADPGGKKGKFELADKGTFFLDEIGELPLHHRAKLLRVLQEKKVERLGAEKENIVDVRIITASNRSLIDMVEKKEFRIDLFHRLSVIPLEIPPLRERKEDILPLTGHFIDYYNQKLDSEVKGLKEEVKEQFLKYPWPGNVRELQNSIEFALNFCRRGFLSRDCLPKKIWESGNFPVNHEEKETLNLEKWEEILIKKALLKHGDNTKGKNKAAQELGINLTTLYRKIQKYGL